MKIKKVEEKSIKKFLNREWKKYNKIYSDIKYDKKFHYFAAYEGDKIVGTIVAVTNGGICYIKDFLVAEGFRRKGIGAKLWERAEKLAKYKNCRKLAIKTNELNKWSIRFYKKHGLKTDAILKNFQFGLNWIYMSKKLK